MQLSHKAEILNKHFASVFTHDDNSPAPDLGSSPYPDLQSFKTPVEEVYNLLILSRLQVLMVSLPNLSHEVSLLHTTTRGHDRHYQIPF